MALVVEGMYAHVEVWRTPKSASCCAGWFAGIWRSGESPILGKWHRNHPRQLVKLSFPVASVSRSLAIQMPRTLGKGLALAEGDRLTTAEGASAIIKLQDGTRMTVRPNSEMVLQRFQYRGVHGQQHGHAVAAWGFGTITGLIARSSPNAARVTTKTATIGIRGTDFDARICGADCKAESAEIAEQLQAQYDSGQCESHLRGWRSSAVDAAGARRRLVAGGSVYAGETVETGMGTKAVLAFRGEVNHAQLQYTPARGQLRV